MPGKGLKIRKRILTHDPLFERLTNNLASTGLLTVTFVKQEDVTTEEQKDKDEVPSTLEEKFGPAEVKVKEGVAVDMLSGSEAEDSTSEDSSDGEGGKKDDGN